MRKSLHDLKTDLVYVIKAKDRIISCNNLSRVPKFSEVVERTTLDVITYA